MIFSYGHQSHFLSAITMIKNNLIFGRNFLEISINTYDEILYIK